MGDGGLESRLCQSRRGRRSSEAAKTDRILSAALSFYLSAARLAPFPPHSNPFASASFQLLFSPSFFSSIAPLEKEDEDEVEEARMDRVGKEEERTYHFQTAMLSFFPPSPSSSHHPISNSSLLSLPKTTATEGSGGCSSLSSLLP